MPPNISGGSIPSVIFEGPSLSVRLLERAFVGRHGPVRASQCENPLEKLREALKDEQAEAHRQQQFDLLADGVRRALDMNALYAAMGLERRSTV